MNDTFYKVKFDNSDQKVEVFFKDYANAAAFLLESYFDDSEVMDEESIMAINNEVADSETIGCIKECWFDD